MLKPVVDPTQMRSFAGMNDSKMVAARVRGKPAAAKVMRRPTAKSGNDDPAVMGDATEPLATAVTKKPSSKAVGVSEVEEVDVDEEEEEECDAEDGGDEGHEDNELKPKATAETKDLCLCDACEERKDRDKFDKKHLYTANRRGTKRVCLECEAIGCSPRNCTIYVCEGSSTTKPHKAGHRNFLDIALRRYKYNRENSTSSGIPFRCISCIEKHCEDERSRKRQKKATALDDATTDEAMVRHLVLQPFEEVWSKLNKWIPRTGPLKGVEVASVSCFLHKAGLARYYASEKVPWLKSGGIAGVDNTSFHLAKMPFKRAGKGWTASEQTLRAIYPYLRLDRSEQTLRGIYLYLRL